MHDQCKKIDILVDILVTVVFNVLEPCVYSEYSISKNDLTDSQSACIWHTSNIFCVMTVMTLRHFVKTVYIYITLHLFIFLVASIFILIISNFCVMFTFLLNHRYIAVLFSATELKYLSFFILIDFI